MWVSNSYIDPNIAKLANLSIIVHLTTLFPNYYGEFPCFKR